MTSATAYMSFENPNTCAPQNAPKFFSGDVNIQIFKHCMLSTSIQINHIILL